MITRKLGKILRGEATPFQLFSACFLGALLGFAPGVSQGPALVLGLVFLLLILKASLGLTLFVAGLAKIASFALAPLSFQLGRMLLDGPTEGLARSLVNAPVLAWCGLEYYAVSGGLVFGAVLGSLVGFLVARTVSRFRLRMVAAAANPGKVTAAAGNPIGRLVLWLVFGSKGKRSWEEKAALRTRLPVRIPGVVLVVLLVAGGWFASSALAGPFAKRALVSGLESANGATVDVDAVDLALGDGRFGVTGLAITDSDDLARDLLRAEELSADVEGTDLLKKRAHVSRLVFSGVVSGAARETPGEYVGSPPPEPEVETEDEGLGGMTLADVLKDWETWKARLEQTRRWLDRLSGLVPEGGEGEAEEGEAGETLAERLERRAREEGWYEVAASHLVEDSPTFRVSELVMDGLVIESLGGKVFDLSAQELSTQPHLVDGAPRAELVAREGDVRFGLDLAPASRGGGDGGIDVLWKGILVDDAMAQLSLDDEPPFSGGTLDLSLAGSWAGGQIGALDLPLRVTFRGTTLTIEGVDPTPLDELELVVDIRGSIDSPRLGFDASRLTKALEEAGKARLAAEVKGKLSEELGELGEKAGVEVPEDVDAIGDTLGDKAGDALGGFLGGKKKKDADG